MNVITHNTTKTILSIVFLGILLFLTQNTLFARGGAEDASQADDTSHHRAKSHKDDSMSGNNNKDNEDV